MERATEKQLDLMDKFKIDYPRNVSKEEAIKLIGESLAQSAGLKSKSEPQAPKSEFKTTTMYVSYAKDLFIALLNKSQGEIDQDALMKLSIGLIGQAKEAFE